VHSAAAQIVVTSAADSGPGTLRDALRTALNGDVITFDPAVFPPAAPVAIRALSGFGCLQSNVTIDASSVGVVLDGNLVPDSQPSPAIALCSSGAAIKGLQIINSSTFPEAESPSVEPGT
jgi:hypothetical protein